MKPFDTEGFIRAYIGAALWSSTGDDDEPLGVLYSTDDLAPGTLGSMRADCEGFINANAEHLAEYCARMGCGRWSGEERAGHDFWLTRCGHGVGFWDRGLGSLGLALSKAAESYGYVDLYVGDDSKVHA
jgi:hypothetical protein